MFPIKEVLGGDVSKWQDNNATPEMMDMKIAHDNGIKFIFIKATQGFAKDPDFYDNWSNAKKAGIPRGAYHFADKSYGTAKQQAENFWNTISFDEGELPPVLDFEARENIGLSFIKYFLEYIDERSKHTPILYTGQSYWDDLMGSSDATWVLQYPLWMSYPDVSLQSPVRGIPASLMDEPELPNTWENYEVPALFWQFTWVGDGMFYGAESKGFDLNVFNGTQTDFDIKYLNGGTEPPNNGAGEDKYVRTLPIMSSDHLRFRTTPLLYPGDTLAVGRGVVMKLVEPDKIPMDGINWWHVELDNRDGFVSAGSRWTERYP